MENLVIKYDHKAIGDRIRTIRQSLGKTTDEFGKYFNPPASKGTISKWENGKYLPNNERLVKIAEIGETSVEYLLKGKEIRDLEGNLMPVSLRLHDYSFLKHYSNTPKNSKYIFLYTIVEITDGKSHYYSGFRSIIQLGQLNLQNKSLSVTVLIDDINKQKFSNVVVDLESNNNFRSEDYHILKKSENFVSFNSFLSQKNMGDKNAYYNLSIALSDVKKNIINDIIDLPSGITYDFSFIFFNEHTTKFKMENIQIKDD